MMSTTVAALTRHRDRQAVEHVIAGEKYATHAEASSGFVFCNERGEPLQGTVVYKYHWRPMLARLGLPAIRLHDCRHTAATLMHEAGYEMKDIQVTSGHATMAITADIYAQVMPERRRHQTRRLAAYLERTRTNKGQSQESK